MVGPHEGRLGMTQESCAGRIWGSGFTPSQCSRPGKYREKLKWWCWQHRPSAKAARRRARDDEWAEKMKEERRIRELNQRRRDAEAKLLDAVLDLRAEVEGGLVPLIEAVLEARKEAP